MKAGCRLLAAFALAMLASACGRGPAGNDEATLVATVDGRPISRAVFDFYVSEVAGSTAGQLAPEQRRQLLDNLVRAEVLAGEAERLGLSGQDQTRFELEMARLQVLQRAVSRQYFRDQPVTEQQIVAEYQSWVSGQPDPKPPLEAVREQIRRLVEEKAFRAYVDALLPTRRIETSP